MLKGAAKGEGRIRSSCRSVLFAYRIGRKGKCASLTRARARATAVVRSGGRVVPTAVHIVFLAARVRRGDARFSAPGERRREGRLGRVGAEPSGAELPISWDPRGVVGSCDPGHRGDQ